MTRSNLVAAKIVPESKRMDTADKHFGIRYPLVVEPMIYQFATQLAPAYSGGYWNFYTISNGGFFMVPKLDEAFKVTADNGNEGPMSAEALGITACLYAFSNLSFTEGTFGKTCADHYERLYQFAIQHPEAVAIRAAVD